MGTMAIFTSWGVLMGHCAGKIAVYGPSGYFPSWGVLIGHCEHEIALYGPSGYFPSWGVLMGHCAGKRVVYGPSGYVSFMECANGPLCRQNSCKWALWLIFLDGVC
jgi:hypothetical protein